jgi:hypothetical protein
MEVTEASLRRAESVSGGLYGAGLAMKYNFGDRHAASHYGWNSREYLQRIKKIRVLTRLLKRLHIGCTDGGGVTYADESLGSLHIYQAK